MSHHGFENFRGGGWGGGWGSEIIVEPSPYLTEAYAPPICNQYMSWNQPCVAPPAYLEFPPVANYGPPPPINYNYNYGMAYAPIPYVPYYGNRISIGGRGFHISLGL